jgi:hypothetical protein
MGRRLNRREFLQTAAVGGAVCLAGCMQARRPVTTAAITQAPYLVSPGCRKSKVKVAKLYMGIPGALWPTPKMDLNEEMQKYEGEFARMSKEFADVDFVVNELVTSTEQAQAVKERLQDVDGVLVIHLSMGIWSMLSEALAAKRPTVLFAIPYSGHEWTGFGALRNRPEGALLECMLTTDYDQLAAAVRPFRVIHHLREAKILNVTTSDFSGYADAMKGKFGTDMVKVSLADIEKAYESIPDADAEAETKRWIRGAMEVVEPSREDIFRSCKLALAFEKMMAEQEATMMTVDCYGTMWDKTILLPAYPCLGFSRLNSMGLGGMCESDLVSAMTQIILQGLSGRPGFVNDPTMDESKNAIISAHCMGTPKMDGPDKPAARYRLRCVMERQEGVTPQVFMEIGRKTTSAKLIGTNQMLYFTGDIIETPDVPRGCRTKITVRVDGDAEKLWQNWSHGLHRVACYGDLTDDLKRFCRFEQIELINEAANSRRTV